MYVIHCAVIRYTDVDEFLLVQRPAVIWAPRPRDLCPTRVGLSRHILARARSSRRAPSDYRAATAPDSVIRKLNVLLDDDPDPSPEVVEVWADSLGNGVVAEHILTYAFLRRATTCQGLEPQVDVYIEVSFSASLR